MSPPVACCVVFNVVHERYWFLRASSTVAERWPSLAHLSAGPAAVGRGHYKSGHKDGTWNYSYKEWRVVEVWKNGKKIKSREIRNRDSQGEGVEPLDSL